MPTCTSVWRLALYSPRDESRTCTLSTYLTAPSGTAHSGGVGALSWPRARYGLEEFHPGTHLQKFHQTSSRLQPGPFICREGV
jgi:hypothetical protein